MTSLHNNLCGSTRWDARTSFNPGGVWVDTLCMRRRHETGISSWGQLHGYKSTRCHRYSSAADGALVTWAAGCSTRPQLPSSTRPHLSFQRITHPLLTVFSGGAIPSPPNSYLTILDPSRPVNTIQPRNPMKQPMFFSWPTPTGFQLPMFCSTKPWLHADATKGLVTLNGTIG